MISKKKALENEIGIDQEVLAVLVEKVILLSDQIRLTNAKYHFISINLREFYRQFKKNFGPEKIPVFHKIVMLELMHQFPIRSKSINVPDSIVEVFQSEFHRIFNLIEQDSLYVFDWTNDFFAKDMGICTFRLIPAGAQLIEVSGLPRSVLVRDLPKIFKNLWYFVFNLRGAKPLYEIHTHSGNLSDFNQDGWNRCYVRIGELLALNPSIKGIQGGSWFYDPKLAAISPRLEYLRSVPCVNGARFFFIRDEGEKSNALAKSESRTKLFESGKYRPRAFLLVWGRAELIEYSKKNRHLLLEIKKIPSTA